MKKILTSIWVYFFRLKEALKKAGVNTDE